MTAIFLQLFWTFFVIGLFNFGGGGAMISLIQSRVVTDLGWITQAQFTDIVAISQTTPGPIGINCATYVGYEVGCHAGTLTSAAGTLSSAALAAPTAGSVALGIAGSALATLALVLPSFLIFWGIVALYKKYRSTPLFGNVMSGLRPVVAGLIGAAALLLMFRFSGSALPGSIGLDVSVLTENFADWTSWVILAATVAASFIFKVNPIILIVLGGILGLIIY